MLFQQASFPDVPVVGTNTKQRYSEDSVVHHDFEGGDRKVLCLCLGYFFRTKGLRKTNYQPQSNTNYYFGGNECMQRNVQLDWGCIL